MNLSSSEAPALHNQAVQRLAAQSAACKLGSVVLTSLVLIMAAGRVGAEVLVWAAAPSLLLALADAAYTVQAKRLTALAAKEAIRAEDLFRLQSGNSGFAASIQTLGGLASFSVWPFYTALAVMVIVLGQTVLVPQNKPTFLPQGPGIYASPYQPNTPPPAYTMQQGPGSLPPGVVAYPGAPNGMPAPSGAPSFQTPPNPMTVSRPNMPPMGVAAKPGAVAAVKPVRGPNGAPSAPVPGFNRPVPGAVPGQPLKTPTGSSATAPGTKPGAASPQPQTVK